MRSFYAPGIVLSHRPKKTFGSSWKNSILPKDSVRACIGVYNIPNQEQVKNCIKQNRICLVPKIYKPTMKDKKKCESGAENDPVDCTGCAFYQAKATRAAIIKINKERA